MKHVIQKGEISKLLSETGGGLSGEVHLIKFENKKYIVRRCPDLQKAKSYEKISKQFERHGFLPKLLGRYGKDVLYEYVEGRDLKENEKLAVLKEIGKIEGIITKIKVKGKVDDRFKKQLNELKTGNYDLSTKEIERRKRNKVNGKLKPIISKEKAKEIQKTFDYLTKKCKPHLTLDANDLTPDNFRITNKGKIYFVDIEAIKPRIKGFGIAKFYTQWGKKEAFNKGYNQVNSLNFLTPEYSDFILLNFLLQKINYKVKIFDRDDYVKQLREIDKLLRKYAVK